MTNQHISWKTKPEQFHYNPNVGIVKPSRFFERGNFQQSKHDFSANGNVNYTKIRHFFPSYTIVTLQSHNNILDAGVT